MVELNSLSYQVLKVRYFPQTPFFDAKIGTNPSYVWRSIMATQNLIKEWGSKTNWFRRPNKNMGSTLGARFD